MRAQAPATIKCLLKGLREAGTSPSFPPRKTLSVGRSRSCKGKQRQESWVVTSWAKGQQAGTKEVVSAQAQKSMHTGIEAASATSVEQEEKKNTSNHLKDSCKCGFSRLVSLLDPSPFPTGLSHRARPPHPAFPAPRMANSLLPWNLCHQARKARRCPFFTGPIHSSGNQAVIL